MKSPSARPLCARSHGRRLARLEWLCVLALGPGASIAEEPKPPSMPVTVFYSREDPFWPQAEQKIGSCVRKYQDRIQLEKVSLDEESGYRRLAQAEKEIPIEKPGELTVVIGRFALTSKGKERRDVEDHLAAALERLLELNAPKRRMEADAAAFARESFGHAGARAVKIDERNGLVYYRAESGAQFLGWVVDAYRAIHCPVCGDAQFLLAAGLDRKVLAVKPVYDLELWGTPLERHQAEKFLAQFRGRTPETRAKVDVVSGATKTGRAYDQAIAEILEDLKTRSQK